jgi:dTDP-N-acetylfucosamine:lipid II N-acetylfucosaminyltransferase
MYAEKFIAPYISLIEKEFDITNHLFLIRKDKNYPIQKKKNIIFLKNGENKVHRVLIYLKYLNDNNVEKIILHGILNKELWCILFIQPWLLKKCYWVIWGGDIYYNFNNKVSIKSIIVEKIMCSVIQKIGFIITYIKGDFALAKSRYSSKAKLLNCLMYSSNTFHPGKKEKFEQDRSINILIGNSAHQSNQHLIAIKSLSRYKENNIKIYCPLSYGSKEYAKKIARIGKEEFGDKFMPLFSFMEKTKYNKFLQTIDIAVFPTNRQQGMGNIITLLGFGKKVFLNQNLTSSKEFKRRKIKIFDINQINLKKINLKDKRNNTNKILRSFTEANLISQWKNIFSMKT